MDSRFIEDDPQSTVAIRLITPNIMTFSLPFSRWGKVKMGGRATLVKLTSGNFAIFSPTNLTPYIRSLVVRLGDDAGGTLKYIIAPDIEHHLWISDWTTAYPQAHVIGPEGLKEKRAKNQEIPQVVFNTIFTKENKPNQGVDEEFDADFECEFVSAHPNKELVFYHKPDKTIIQADLLFNLPATEQYSKAGVSASSGPLTKFFTKMMSTTGTAIGQKRLQWYVFSKNDRAGYRASLLRIQAWDFDRIIPCHGDVISGSAEDPRKAKDIFEKVFNWHIT